MAPAPLDLTEEDDFVRTISDRDSPASDNEHEADFRVSTSKSANSSKKKRAHNLTELNVGESSAQLVPLENGRSGKRRKLQALATSSHSSQVVAREDSGSSEEDDGAMDPDFEFQINQADTGYGADFDDWDIDVTESKENNLAFQAKRGFDIDQLIERRRQNGNGDSLMRASAPKERNSTSQGADQSEDEGGSAREETDEDEHGMLAEDTFGMGSYSDDSEKEEDAAHDLSSDVSSESEAIADSMPELEEVARSSDEEIEGGKGEEEEANLEAFFAPEESSTLRSSSDSQKSSRNFQAMSLSRPILRGLAAMGFASPTPIQKRTIPIALLGKDVVGGAVTGSGKTAAFIIPILERLIYRPKKIPTSRVAILMPTRELAVQCFEVSKKLASFTDITFSLLTGGFSLREQEIILKKRPDVIIATPGRFIDHMRNSASFTVDTLEILVLDEADRMLDDGFADELDEILKTIPKSRQTMLFSATMTERLDKLIRAGLKQPVRLMADPRKQTVGTLVQEFVRLRPGKEEKRMAYLMYLCANVYKDRVIIFFRQKKEAHRARVIFGLGGIKAGELHGSMSQEQRISALSSFRDGHSTHLLATDLASRGLDIPSVSVVLNYEAPQTHEIYLHRVGRTARAGRSGRSCTIAAEPDRKIVKQAVRAAKAQGAKIASRTIDPATADQWAMKVASMEAEVDAILKEEKEEKLLSQSDMSIRKGENIIKFDEEIHARPKRTWFETEKDKLQAKKAGKEELNGRVGLGKGRSKGKLSGKEKKGLDDKRQRVEGRTWKKGKEDVGKRKGKSKPGGAKGDHRSKGRMRAKPGKK